MVAVTPDTEIEAKVSGDRKFLTVTPTTGFTGNASGEITLQIQGDYLEDFDRIRLQFQGGTRAGDFHESFTFALTDPGPATLPLPIPSQPDDPAGVWVIGGMPIEGTDQVVVDPATGVAFPMEMSYADGLLTLTNDAGSPPASLRAYLMVDTSPAATATLTVE